MNPLKWRKMTWAILIFSGLMLAWAISGAVGSECDKYPAGSNERSGCELGEDIGTGVGVFLLFILWFLGFLVLSLIWIMSRPRHRQCPRCGEDVKKGRTTCKKCGYDFAAAGEQSGPPAGPARPEPRRETGP